jgi:hypothetical protein
MNPVMPTEKEKRSPPLLLFPQGEEESTTFVIPAIFNRESILGFQDGYPPTTAGMTDVNQPTTRRRGHESAN